MNVAQLKQHLATLTAIRFKLPEGSYLPEHFHVTEVGLINKHFIDCGGTERKETIASFQLWEAGDFDHRLAPQKFIDILNLSASILGNDALEIEVEYQQNTISKFGLDFDGNDFLLTPKFTACLAADACGIPEKKKLSLRNLSLQSSCCTPGSGCC